LVADFIFTLSESGLKAGGVEGLKVDAMPKTRAQKATIVDELADKMRRMKSAVFVSVHGYTMTDADGMRKKGREVGVDVVIAKKTLLKRAAEQAEVTAVDPQAFEGSVLSAFAYQDDISAAKLMAGLVKEKDQMKILGGLLEGVMVDAAKVKQLATLPSKQELLSKLVGSLHAPISGFVNVLAGNLRSFVHVLNAIKEGKE
jgi:large subunit ribosomal protein L10